MPVTGAVRELWRKYIHDAAPINTDVDWDHLRVEIWLDSGRIILFPAVSPFRRRIEKSCCQIICPDLLNFYETLIEGNTPDDEFERALIRKEQEVTLLLSDAARETKLANGLKKPRVRVLYYGADLEQPLREDQFTPDAARDA